jgi:hypothetical protein
MTDIGSVESKPATSGRLLAILGVLWILLGVWIITTQLNWSPTVEINWQTETEVNTAGFNLYRSSSRDAAYQQINEELVPSKGSSVSGASYTFEDTDVTAGQTYYYQLEDVELDNSRERHPVFDHVAPSLPWWMPVTSAFSLLAGILLLVRGLRAERRV